MTPNSDRELRSSSNYCLELVSTLNTPDILFNNFGVPTCVVQFMANL